jgi:hypothetical protein
MVLKLIVMCLPEWLRPTDCTSFRYRACPSLGGAGRFVRDKAPWRDKMWKWAYGAPVLASRPTRVV